MGGEDILTEEQFLRELDRYVNMSFPLSWAPAKARMMNSVRAALKMTRPSMEDALMLDDPALLLLEEALPHLPDELAERVRLLLEV